MHHVLSELIRSFIQHVAYLPRRGQEEGASDTHVSMCIFMYQSGLPASAQRDRVYFIFRERARGGERGREKHPCVVAYCAPSTGDLARDPGMGPDWESNL